MKYSVAARGILVKEGKVLLVEYETPNGVCYALPGGGQEVGEPLQETLKREFLEETSLEIVVGELALVREFILETSDLEIWKDGVHQVEVIFFCGLAGEQKAEMGSVLDPYMTGVKWMELSTLDDLVVYPQNLKDLIEKENVPYVLEDGRVKNVVDKWGILEDSPFDYKTTKNGKVLLYYHGKLVKTIQGKKATSFLKKLEGKNEWAVQLLLAKETGNFKRGNEKSGR